MHPSSIRQSEAAECGLACLAIASGLLGARQHMIDLRRKFPGSVRGMTLDDLMRTASGLQMTARPVRCDPEQLRELQTPAVLHWSMNHYVVLRNVDRRGATIQDPASGIRRFTKKELGRHFTGVALELSPTPEFKRVRSRSPLKLTSLFRITPAMKGGLAQVLILSVLLQAHVVASPFYMQLAIDEAALKGDKGLLGVLAVGFALFGLFNLGATALRGIAIQKTSALFGWDMTNRLFHHLIRLPLPWFQRRRLADALSRFESIDPVRNLLASGLVGSVIDGLLATVTLVMMFVFAWKLAAVAVTALAVYVLVRLVSISFTMRLAGDALVATIAEKGKRIETLRSIQTIKVMGGEVQREGDWANTFSDTIRTSQSNAMAGIVFSSVQGATDTLATIAIVFLGAHGVIENSMTIGVLYAFISYRTQFAARAQGLFETFVQWRMLDLHSERIADIALHPIESGIDDPGIGLAPMVGRIELRHLAFRYSSQEPVIFQGVDAVIEPGEFIAIIGPSGAGKSTLVKAICGLYPPSAGEVMIDGLSLASWGPQAVRRNLGVVLQDDELLAGSIAENVAFFAEEIDMDWVWDCLRSAAIDEEIRLMPMKAETFVGDMGSALSGGQKQRILLARALYRRPRIMVLDEATSHLDIGRERSINAAVRSQEITRIIVAHRPETIAAADRVFVLQNGALEEVRAANTAL